MSDDRKVIRISADSDKIVRKYAKDREIDIGEAVDRLLSTAQSRLNALAKYGTKEKAATKRPSKPPSGKPKKSKRTKAAESATV